MDSHRLSERSFSIGEVQSKLSEPPAEAPHLAITLAPANQQTKTEQFERRGRDALYHDGSIFCAGSASRGGSVIGGCLS
jgi:hypothetical protein